VRVVAKKTVAKIALVLTLIAGLMIGAASANTHHDKSPRVAWATLYGEVNQSTSWLAISQIQAAQRLPKGTPIILVIDSPGGEVFAGRRVIDEMLASDAAGHPVMTLCVGDCDSMAAFIFEYGAQRWMTPSARLMFHNASGGVSGELPEEASDLASVIEVVDGLNQNIAARSNVPVDELIAREQHRWWVGAREAKARHLADQVILIAVYPLPGKEQISGMESKADHAKAER
jgi:ATP-dependent Clp protease protease subunit